ncbi:HlyD family efflux transporter periplasmic adaptor subunit [Sulfurimonas microaerophilic]|uniref:HlyD family efflux transporter periplasmic adaptor subunit n=1 Tax=Sulfurimonas microaerophilic TaxID=3058392 RepID=UPI00271532ED|nr:HlyD family efflux transporter periplasmic adaptor subunit [Sulfurimonas sp. hsl 1-7]
MKLFSLLVFLSTLAYSQVYYSKVEPYEMRTISSNVSGEVLDIAENMIGKKLTKDIYIKIDDMLDKDELSDVKQKITFIEETIKVNQEILENLNLSLEKKELNYKKVAALKIKSKIEKDNEFYNLVTSRNLALSTKKEIKNLKIQLADLNLRQKQLEKIIQDKNLRNKGLVLYSIDVKVGQVVAPGMALAKIADTSKGLLSIYVTEDELINLKDKVVYIDGDKTVYKPTRILSIADEKNISKYLVQIVINPPKIFSKLVKIELKEK